jgi:hypothetical protein
MMSKRKYDSTVARVAGNIASGIVDIDLIDAMSATIPEEAKTRHCHAIARVSVVIARMIIEEVMNTEPVESDAVYVTHADGDTRLYPPRNWCLPHDHCWDGSSPQAAQRCLCGVKTWAERKNSLSL